MKAVKKPNILLFFLAVLNLKVCNICAQPGAGPTSGYTVESKIPLFLGNECRRYYGKGPVPEKLRVLWKKHLETGETRVWGENKSYSGTGWPGQAVLVEENARLYVIFGGFDYKLRKLDALTGKTMWEYRFNNVIKGAPSIYINPKAVPPEEKCLVFCGSRRGPLENNDPDNNYRAVSLLTGRELWSFIVPNTDSYSRDAEGNGLVHGGILFFPAENGVLYQINPDPASAVMTQGITQPKVLREIVLYDIEDIFKHNKNLVVESSPSRIGNMLYLTAGAGRVYGINIERNIIEWEFYIGSDLDASPVITNDGNLLVGVEKQYIDGKGGVINLNPRKTGLGAVAWYFPTQNRKVADWEGGVIGSVGINDEYNPGDDKPALSAIGAIDGNLYLVSQDELSGEKVFGPDGLKLFNTPKMVWKKNIGSIVSTPILVDDYLIAGGHSGVLHVFKIIYDEIKDGTTGNEPNVLTSRTGRVWHISVREKGNIALGGSIESTPVVWENKIYIGDKSGNFYCIGGKQ
ncbi:MAG: hypothetical protein A2297_05940 [Elusimicrobia bacterium RIFOXYB2_FULL_48_7]|nr:MAG: hypothetical protein A2297_05940 [Elusimicrobia bacterium RIFOXYB2_FULL_48_7]